MGVYVELRGFVVAGRVIALATILLATGRARVASCSQVVSLQ